MAQALMRDGVARMVNGRAATDDPECADPCCEPCVCQVFYLIEPCPGVPAGECAPVEPPFDRAWLCDRVECEGLGRPIEPGDVVYLMGWCWTVTDTTAEYHEIDRGDRIVGWPHQMCFTVRCVPDCASSVCGQQVWFLVRPCPGSPEPTPRVYACGRDVVEALRSGICYVACVAVAGYPPQCMTADVEAFVSGSEPPPADRIVEGPPQHYSCCDCHDTCAPRDECDHDHPSWCDVADQGGSVRARLDAIEDQYRFDCDDCDDDTCGALEPDLRGVGPCDCCCHETRVGGVGVIRTEDFQQSSTQGQGSRTVTTRIYRIRGGCWQRTDLTYTEVYRNGSIDNIIRDRNDYDNCPDTGECDPSKQPGDIGGCWGCHAEAVGFGLFPMCTSEGCCGGSFGESCVGPFTMEGSWTCRAITGNSSYRQEWDADFWSGPPGADRTSESHRCEAALVISDDGSCEALCDGRRPPPPLVPNLPAPLPDPGSLPPGASLEDVLSAYGVNLDRLEAVAPKRPLRTPGDFLEDL